MKNFKQVITNSIGIILATLTITVIGLWIIIPTASASEDYELRYQQEAEKIQLHTEQLSNLNIELDYIRRLLDNKQTQVRAKELELQAAKEGLYLLEIEYCRYKIDHSDLYSQESIDRCFDKLAGLQ